MTHRFVAGIVLLLVACVSTQGAENSLTEQEKKDGWQLIFDGQSTTGWMTPKEKPLPQTHVQEGALNPQSL